MIQSLRDEIEIRLTEVLRQSRRPADRPFLLSAIRFLLGQLRLVNGAEKNHVEW